MQNKGRGTERQETEGKMKGNGFLGKKFRGHVPGEKITGFSARRICRKPERTGTGRDRKGEMIYVDAQHFWRELIG